MSTVADWVKMLDSWFPQTWAEPWDNPGLQVGDPAGETGRLLTALDPTIEVIREAAENDAQLLITHHPLLFGAGTTSLDLGEPGGAAVAEAIRGGVAVFACHTNADVASPGVSDVLADRLGVAVTGPLEPTGAGQRVKLVTFVPVSETHEIIQRLARSGAGVIGEYDVCSFRVAGIGTFRPSQGSSPRTGKKKVVNEVDEDRLEMVVPKDRLREVIQVLVEAHPYEEVAYDVYDLSGPTGLGLGRIGDLSDEMSADGLRKNCEEKLGSGARLVGNPNASVRRVAVCGGSGGSFVGVAASAGADAFVTSDVKHHEALGAVAAGLALIDAGHFATEWPWVEQVAARLEAGGADVRVSELRTDPFEAVR